MTAGRISQAGDAALLLQYDERIDPLVNARAVAAAARVRAARIAGVRDVVATFRSVAVYFDPRRTDVAQVVEELQREPAAAPRVQAGRSVEIPVVYGGDAGPDLAALAARAGLTTDEVVARHMARTYRVFMLGFLPGFGYMASVDPSIAAPRHDSPRARVAAGSVGIAGAQTGVYPQASPGGWQIIGRTGLRLFDPSRTPAALLAPGDEVRFVAAEGRGADVPADGATPIPNHAGQKWARAVTVLQPGLLTSVQDGGRWGHQHEGVPVAGAMDLPSLRRANAVVGNATDAAALEVTLAACELRMEHEGRVAVAGADLGAVLDGRAVPLDEPLPCARGSILRFTARRAGARAYVAFDGGLDVPPLLGSRATDLTSGLGGVEGRRLRAGDVVAVGAARRPDPASAPRLRPAVAAGGARVRVMAGPHDGWFPADAMDQLRRTRFSITPESNRMGYRLAGERPIPRRTDREMISDATFRGALQVPPSGQPILLMADRQVTGGYPLLATVITADLPVVGQLAPGDWIEFEPCSRADAVAALAARDAARGADV